MALASQTGGPIRRNRYMYRRRRTHPGRWFGLLFLVAVVAAITWYMLPELDEESPGRTNTPNAAQVVEETTPLPQVAAQEPLREPEAIAVVAPGPPRSEPAAPVVESVTPSVMLAEAIGLPSDTETVSNVVPIPPTLVVPKHAATNGVSAKVAKAFKLTQSDPITARRQLSDLLASGNLSASDRHKVRSELTMLGNILLFNPSMQPNDTYSRRYVIQGGDSLARIASRENSNVDWRMIQRINRISNPDSIKAGDSLKLPVGTFHSVVYKSEFLLELHLENEDGRILVATYPVGLGEYDGTPLGLFMVKPKSKLINPQWTNPRTGEFFASNNPSNPIGERWFGLRGMDPDNAELVGYGIHGTIDPSSIGRMRSMGCVRLLDEHVQIVYEAMSESGSTIEIKP